jgi:leucyl aminopeptidase (aminopeptidase T)
MYRIAHWSYSYNPGARLTPTSAVIEAERVLGLVHFGVGSQAKPVGGKGWRAPAHADGGVLAPSVFLDGTAIEKDGRYVHPKLVKLCRQMGLRGY